MSEKSAIARGKIHTARGIVTGAVTGGILGAVAVFLYKTGTLNIPILGVLPVDAAITGTVLGGIFGGGMGALFQLYALEDRTDGYGAYQSDDEVPGELVDDTDGNSRLLLREERLDIARKVVETSAVNVHKEIVTEEKNIVVPVIREELVIEKKVIDEEGRGKREGHTETIRIPISEERIEVKKRHVPLENVDIYKQRVQETRRVEETLKKEQLRVETDGDAQIIDQGTDKH